MHRKSIFALAIVLLLVVAMLSACGQKPPTPAPAPSPGPAPSEDGPVRGGTLVQLSFVDAEHLNPHLFTPGGSGESFVRHMFNGLIKLSPEDGQPIPDLAKSWEVSQDGKVWTFKLREDVKWHDGERFTAKDVKHTFDIIMHPEYLGHRKATHGDPVKEVKVIDDFTVEFTLEEPFAPFLMNLDLRITPEHLLKDGIGKAMANHPFNRNPVGTGPFKFDKWLSGDRVELVAFDDYFLGRPNIDRLVYSIVPDIDAIVMTYEAGRADLIFFDARQRDLVEAIPNTTILQRPGLFMDTLFFNTTKPPLDDKAVRQAIMLATDKDAIARAVLRGAGTNMDSYINPQSVFASQNIKKYPFDPAQAAKVLDDAGWKLNPNTGIREKNGVPLKFELCTHSGNLRRSATNEILQEMWKAVGMDVELAIYEVSTYWSQRLMNKEHQVGLFGFAVPFDPDESLNQFVTDGGRNTSGFSNARVDELYQLARVTTDIAKRAEYYKEIQEIVAEEVPYGFLSLRDLHTAYRSHIKGIELKPFGGRSDNDTFEYNIHEWWIEPK